ncbi:ATP-grasp domain-containing protein [Azospirillum rugosum]|uniref:ATP-grasp superfamily ATP-dependent carboligase n=1 Tax=Azospirillum rugosum TaxID=416170 RepID=A0ABS4SUP6_9PROT|nr:ATP-grasp domain-containing protein [Azospirillum rugosum]MBP2296281.1 putative ATP-grasp superfamily ATP-dependent carboligase [Azospirillum rugosum]MDQ0529802.1 putative ATP-grasp superfamily ATP-dependent carboligase [Azospirillum rugosum]
MRILVCEFVTGGGMPPDAPIPASLAREGDLMLRALVGDLLEVPGVEVTVTRDARLPPMHPPVRSITIDDPRTSWAHWEDLAREADAVWPIAPETEGALERFSRMVESAGRRLLNSAADAVAVASSKAATAAALSAAGLPVVPGWPVGGLGADGPRGDGPWVVKPDDGAGCVDTRLIRDRSEWTAWLEEADRAGFVAQPFQPGTPASLSMLCRDGRAWLLTVNRQDVCLSGRFFAYGGGIVGGMPTTPPLADLARGVAAALPGLFGYVGVDVIAGPDGPTILEVNPRLTSSYVGLRRATGLNIAAAVLDLARDPPVPPSPLERVEPVHLNLEG